MATRSWRTFPSIPWDGAWFWFFCALIVSLARISEIGTSLDPALYSSIARTFARNGKWWSLSASPNLFPQVFEHPFLAFWLNGLLFKILPASDYSSRIIGLLFGAGSFYWLYGIGKLLMDARYASVLCFLSLASVHFTGRMPSFYLDVPLVFFLLAAFYYMLRASRDRSNLPGLAAGVCLGLAFLTKGLAAAPGVALVVALAVHRERLAAWRLVPLWICLAATTLIVAAFCVAQRAFGEYSFVDSYLRVTLSKTTLADGFHFFPPGFFFKLLQLHPVHLVFVALAPVVVWKHRGLWEPFVVGCFASTIFLFSQGSLRSLWPHYFYPLYPMLNLLAAVGVYPWVERFEARAPERWAFRIALIYLVLWHALPVPMRQKGMVDFFQLDAPMRAIKRAGISELDAVGISSLDWTYRDISLWYWDLDSRMVPATGEVRSKAAILPREGGLEADLLGKGFLLCAGSPRYLVLVRDAPLQRACQQEPMSDRLIR